MWSPFLNLRGPACWPIEALPFVGVLFKRQVAIAAKSLESEEFVVRVGN